MAEAQTQTCQNCKGRFSIDSADLSFYQRIDVPPPSLCPDCRYQRRLGNRNEWNFYKRDCTLCGKGMVSIYNPSYPGPVYCQSCYWSDNWDPLDYGLDFDFSRPFFEQFYEHRYKVPRITLANAKSVDSEYTNQTNNNRNCYMCVATNTCEYCMYGNWNQSSKECVDCWNVDKCEMMYESLFCDNCYHCAFVNDCGSSHDIYFCDDMVGCSDCFGCVGLRGKSYCWFNEQLGKAEYERRFSAVDWSREGIRENQRQLRELRLRKPVDYFHGDHNVSSSGDYIDHNKNTRDAFNCGKNENVRYVQDAWEARDCRDLTETLDNELEYELEGAGWSHGSMFSCKLWTGLDVLYSELTFHSEHLLGCVSMIKKNYCIFNKQYSPEDWKEMKARIVAHMKQTGEWGEFFPISISPFPYSDSVAQDYFPLTQAQVAARGWRWHERDVRDYKVSLRHGELPPAISETQDKILSEVISCSTQDSEEERGTHLRCATAFRLNPAELDFYRKMGLPVPHKCFPCRLQERLDRRNPRRLWKRKCMCEGAQNVEGARQANQMNTADHFHGNGRCPNEFETSYAPDRPEIIYCEQCYQAEVV